MDAYVAAEAEADARELRWELRREWARETWERQRMEEEEEETRRPEEAKRKRDRRLEEEEEEREQKRQRQRFVNQFAFFTNEI
jgi:hypothetical protein